LFIGSTGVLKKETEVKPSNFAKPVQGHGFNTFMGLRRRSYENAPL